MSQPVDLSRFLDTFVTEARERLDRFEQGVIALEANPADAETVRELLREAHTIKGSARMVGLGRIAFLAHRTENILAGLRDHTHVVTRKVIDCLLAAADGLRNLVAETAGEQPEGTYQPEKLVERLEQLLGDTGGEPAPSSEPRERQRPGKAGPGAEAAAPAEPAAKPEPAPKAVPLGTGEEGTRRRRNLDPTIRVSMGKLEQLSNLTLDLTINREHDRSLASNMAGFISEARRTHRTLSQIAEQAGNLAHVLADSGEHILDELGTVRHDISALVEAVRILERRTNAALQGWLNLQRRDALLAEELRVLVTELHLIPISTIFDTFPRAVRDIANEYGKDVQLQIEGGDTQLDKKIVEELGEPLLHLVRNCIAHGIDTTEQRRQIGKPTRGTIQLTARPNGDRIQVQVRDDGAGIDVEAVRAAAVERGLLGAEEAALLNDRQAVNLIFLPGLSTTRMATDVSGRGVGMDIVESTIRRLNGTVNVETEKGKGTTITVDLPLSVAVMSVVMVKVADTTVAVPTSLIEHVAQVSAEDVQQAQGQQVAWVEEAAVPVVELAEVLGLPATGWNGRTRPLLVAGAAGSRAGFAVDQVVEESMVVVKSLASCPVRLKLVMAATVGPSGRVVPILDMAGLVEASRMPATAVTPSLEQHERQRSVLVVDDSAVTSDLERNILEGAGYLVRVANDGVEALRMLGEHPYDLVVIDLEMPRLDGFGLLERIRGQVATQELPVVVVTSRRGQQDRERGMRLGANAYITKATFDQSALLETVRGLVG